MDLGALWIAVRNRAKADTGAGGLFAASVPLITDIFWNHVPAGQPMPFVVFDNEADTQQDAFRLELSELRVRFSIYVENSPVYSEEPATVLSRIARRIKGDWTDQGAGTEPTYGFARWTPVLTASNYTCTPMQRVGSRAAHEDGYLRLIETYRLWMNDPAA